MSRDTPAAPTAEAREAVAAWMIEHGHATGHGDTLDDLLDELVRSARSTPAEALDVLTQIASAKRRVSDCPTPGRCMYPQHHADDESHAEFADRLQRLALARLSPHNREAGE